MKIKFKLEALNETNLEPCTLDLEPVFIILIQLFLFYKGKRTMKNNFVEKIMTSVTIS